MKPRIFAAGLALAATLTGCVVAPAGRPYDYSYSEPVMVAPPPPRVEYYGAPPVAGQIWIDGYWNWTGHHHDWVPGRWAAPRPGQTWVPHRWERDGDRWYHRGGRWEERHEREHDRRGW